MADGRETILFSVQCLTAKAIHMGFTVREVRSQPLHLHFHALKLRMRPWYVFSKSSNVDLVISSFLSTLRKLFLYLDALTVAAWRSPPEFCSAAARRKVNVSTRCWAIADSQTRSSYSCSKSFLASARTIFNVRILLS